MGGQQAYRPSDWQVEEEELSGGLACDRNEARTGV